MHTAHHSDLKTLLEVARPSSLLLIDPNPDALPPEGLPEGCRVTRIAGEVLEQLRTLERCDLGVVANTLEYLDHRTAGQILARLRDVNTRRFVALVPIGDAWEDQKSHWQPSDLLGYGMTIMARYKVDGKPLHLYHYSIASYKSTPEWFNAQHWAHPENWRP